MWHNHATAPTIALSSTSTAQLIQISEDTNEVLKRFGGFHTEFRGHIEVKVWFVLNIDRFHSILRDIKDKRHGGHVGAQNER